MQFKVGIKTDIGRKRAQNQDSAAAVPELGLFIVSDGMGGHKGGEIASATAVEVISESVKKSTQENQNWNPKDVLVDAIQKANLAIYDKAVDNPSLQGMGTTTTALLFHDNQLVIGQVGDSRCYFLRPEEIWQITRDHSLVQEKLKAGIITREQVKTDRMKNIITRSVGFERNLDVETYSMETHPGDCFLICSDGLSGLIEDSHILEIAQKDLFENGEIQKTVEDLIGLANNNGGDDNITSILVQVT